MTLQHITKNNFDTVRITLAVIVVFAHLAALTALPEFATIASIFDANIAVKGFFAISGFLVMKSYLSNQNIKEYTAKRLRRIYPAYAAAILLCVGVGAFASTLPLSDFAAAAQTWKYIIANLSFLNFLQPTLPQTFADNPMAAMNGALWTIKVEVMLYACIPLIAWCFHKLGAAKTTAATLLLSAGWVYYFTIIYQDSIGPEISRQFPGQLAYFTLGSLFYVSSHIRPKLPLIAAISLCLLFTTNDPVARIFIDPICYSSVIIYLCTTACKTIPTGKYGDVAYGIYLFHFPIIQLFVQLGTFKSNPWLGMCLTLACTLIAAFISWHLIEKRFLKRNSHYLLASHQQ